MEYPDFLQPVLSRINPDYGVVISCESGWWNIISKCDKELSSIDPDYTIFQIKEKFGGLRYYFSPSNPEYAAKMEEIVQKYEKICSMTCEVTGRHGYLMKKSFRYRTLHDSYIQQGWTKVGE